MYHFKALAALTFLPLLPLYPPTGLTVLPFFYHLAPLRGAKFYHFTAFSALKFFYRYYHFTQLLGIPLYCSRSILATYRAYRFTIPDPLLAKHIFPFPPMFGISPFPYYTLSGWSLYHFYRDGALRGFPFTILHFRPNRLLELHRDYHFNGIAPFYRFYETGFVLTFPHLPA